MKAQHLGVAVTRALLLFAPCTSQVVESRSMVMGVSPGPAPRAQTCVINASATAWSSSNLTDRSAGVCKDCVEKASFFSCGTWCVVTQFLPLGDALSRMVSPSDQHFHGG